MQLLRPNTFIHGTVAFTTAPSSPNSAKPGLSWRDQTGQGYTPGLAQLACLQGLGLGLLQLDTAACLGLNQVRQRSHLEGNSASRKMGVVQSPRAGLRGEVGSTPGLRKALRTHSS